ncbi:arylamine N-acetyltransferase family protein [Nocardioides sp.]|uniref:arylamine N-acetyltransferase family protein n=1 Tax=Nocardioides sp. TaxID=35761 RepID=UPI003D0D1F1D
MTTTTSELAPYLLRLGYDEPPPPTLETLHDLHRRHLRFIPYDNLSIQLGDPDPVDRASCLERVGRTGRLGYCFHQNTAAEALLLGLGYGVERRHGHVFAAAEDDDALNHLVLLVRVPGAAGPPWWFDVGLGDAFDAPLPLVAGAVRDPAGFEYSLEDVTESGWTFRHDPSGTFAGVRVSPLDAGPRAVAPAHRVLSTDPASGFVRILAVLRRDAAGVDVLRGCMLSRVLPDRTEAQEVAVYADWRSALIDAVGLPVDDVEPQALRALFERTLAAHRAWTDAGRP